MSERQGTPADARNSAQRLGLRALLRSLSRIIRNSTAEHSDDGLIRSLPIIFEIAAPFERVAPRVLPMNWGTCISAIQIKVLTWDPTPTGWTGSVEERVTIGPMGLRTISSRLRVVVVETCNGKPSDDSIRVRYELEQDNDQLLRDEGALAVYRHAELPESHSVLIVEKTLQFKNRFDATVLSGTGLRAVLQNWLAAAADDECWGGQWRSAPGVATPALLDGVPSP